MVLAVAFGLGGSVNQNMGSLKRLWEARDEFLVRNIRFSKWNVVFLFAACVIMGHMRIGAFDGYMPAFGPFAFQAMGYGVGVLVFAFLPHSHILDVGRFGAVLALASLVAKAAAPQAAGAVLSLICSFAVGLCIGGALYVFFFMLNNTERFLNMIVIELYYVVCVYGSLCREASPRISEMLAYVFAVFFAVAMFAVKKGEVTEKALPKKGHCGADDGCCRVGRSGNGAVFYLYVVFMAVYSLSTFIVWKESYVVYTAYTVGAFAAIAFAVIAQMLIVKSTWYTWKIFLIGTLASTAILAIDGIFDPRLGSLLYGLANSLGHIAIFYLVGSAANITGCLKFFRTFCIIEFLLSFALNPAVEYLFLGNEENNSLIALGLMAGIACVTLAVYPVLHRQIFESEWIKDINILNPEKFAHSHEGDVANTHADGLGLTPREKQIFAMMLTEMSVKQIMLELEISRGTFNFHTANLYRKLGIQSRTELFAKHGSKE